MTDQLRRKPWRTLLLLSAVIAASALVLSACGGSSSSSSSSTAESTSTEESSTTEQASSGSGESAEVVAEFTKTQPELEIPALSKSPPSGKTVSFVACNLPTCEAESGKPAAAVLGWNLKIHSYDIAKGPEAIVSAFEAALRDKPDYILLENPFPMEVIAKQVEQAKAEGIPMVAVAGAEGLTPGVVGCVGCTPTLEATGALQVDVAAADGGNEAKAVYASDPTVTGAVRELEGAEARAAKIGGLSLDKVDLSLVKTPAENAATVVSYLQRNPEVEYVISGINDLVVGVPTALEQAGLSEKVQLIGTVPEPTDFEYIKQGKMLSAVSHESTSLDWRALDLFARLSVGEEIPAEMSQPVGWLQVFDKTNIPSSNPGPPNYQQTFTKAWMAK